MCCWAWWDFRDTWVCWGTHGPTVTENEGRESNESKYWSNGELAMLDPPHTHRLLHPEVSGLQGDWLTPGSYWIKHSSCRLKGEVELVLECLSSKEAAGQPSQQQHSARQLFLWSSARSSKPRREDWSPAGPAATVLRLGCRRSDLSSMCCLVPGASQALCPGFLWPRSKFYHERSGELGARLCCWAQPAWLHSSALPVAPAAAVRELNLKFELVFKHHAQNRIQASLSPIQHTVLYGGKRGAVGTGVRHPGCF